MDRGQPELGAQKPPPQGATRENRSPEPLARVSHRNLVPGSRKVDARLVRELPQLSHADVIRVAASQWGALASMLWEVLVSEEHGVRTTTNLPTYPYLGGNYNYGWGRRPAAAREGRRRRDEPAVSPKASRRENGP